MKIDDVTKMFLEQYLREGNVERVRDSISNAINRHDDSEYVSSFTEILCSNPSGFGKVAEAVWKDSDQSQQEFITQAVRANDSSAIIAQFVPVLRRHAPADINTLLDSDNNYESAKDVLLGSRNTTVSELGMLFKKKQGQGITHLVRDMLQSGDKTRHGIAVQAIIKYGSDQEVHDLAHGICKGSGSDADAKLRFCESAAKESKLGLIDIDDFRAGMQGHDPEKCKGLTQGYLVQHLATIVGAKNTLSDADKIAMQKVVVSVLGAFSDKAEDIQNTADRVVRACISVSGKNLGFKERCNKIIDAIKDICPILFYSKEERRLRDIVRGSEEAVALKDTNIRLEKLSGKLTQPVIPQSTEPRQDTRTK